MENHYIQLIQNYLTLHPHIGLVFTFIVAFSESLPIIGTIVPGSITMTLIGVLVGMGIMPAMLTLVIASIAAFIGDCIGFILGYTYNHRIRTIWPFKNRPHWLSAGEKFVAKHGGKSIVLGRFIGPARSTVPLIAGLLRLSWIRFSIAAIPSAFLWALMYTVPGMMIGALSREVPKGETTRFFLYGLGILAVIWLCFWLIQHFFIQLARFINHVTDRCWRYLSHKNGGRFFIRLITNQQNPRDHHQLTMLFSGLLSGILFLILFWKVRHFGVWQGLNYSPFHLLQSIRTPLFDKLFIVITIMGTPKIIAVMSVLMTMLLFIKKQWRTATHFFAGFILSAGAVLVFKVLSHSPRPQGFEFVAPTSSFPSGHTTLSFVMFTLLAFFSTQIIQKKYHWIAWTLACPFILLVAFSRLYLGAHWFSDIVGSFLLGFTIVTVCIISYRRMPNAHSKLHLNSRFAILSLLIGLGIPWFISIPYGFQKNLARYTPIWFQQKITIEAWWNNPLLYTPLYRNDRFGKPFQPLNVQWQGSLNAITKTLMTTGWRPVSSQKKLQRALQRLASVDAQYHLPLFSWLYRDKPPVIFFIKPILKKNQVIEIRLWDSNIHLQPGNQPLWLGETDILIPPKKLLSLKERARISLQNAGGLNVLMNSTTHFERKFITVSASQWPDTIRKLEWDGKILLIREPVTML